MSISRERTEKLLTDHIGRINPADAPEPDTEAFRDAITTWKEAFDDLGYQPAELARASRRTARTPSPWWREQLPALLAAVELERSANMAQGPDAPTAPASDRETAWAASRGCELCEGTGLVFVFDRRYAGSPVLTIEQPDGSHRRVMGRFQIACSCAFGRWTLDRIRASDAVTAKRLEGIEAVVEGRSRYVAWDPTHQDQPAVRYAPGRPGEALRDARAAY